MEPGDLRESPAGSGESDGGEWREVIPGGEEENKPVETNVDTMDLTLRDAYEELENEKQKCAGEQFHSPYEEELDPRIQVRTLTCAPPGLLIHHCANQTLCSDLNECFVSSLVT